MLHSLRPQAMDICQHMTPACLRKRRIGHVKHFTAAPVLVFGICQSLFERMHHQVISSAHAMREQGGSVSVCRTFITGNHA